MNILELIMEIFRKKHILRLSGGNQAKDKKTHDDKLMQEDIKTEKNIFEALEKTDTNVADKLTVDKRLLTEQEIKEYGRTASEFVRVVNEMESYKDINKTDMRSFKLSLIKCLEEQSYYKDQYNNYISLLEEGNKDETDRYLAEVLDTIKTRVMRKYKSVIEEYEKSKNKEEVDFKEYIKVNTQDNTQKLDIDRIVDDYTNGNKDMFEHTDEYED